MEATQSQSLENHLTRMQEQVEQLQTAHSRPSHSLASIWTSNAGHSKPPNQDIAPFGNPLIKTLRLLEVTFYIGRSFGICLKQQ